MSDTSPAVILVGIAGTQVGTSASPIFVSGSAITPSVTINNYIISGAAGLQGATGSAGPAGPDGAPGIGSATGSWRDPGNTFVTTGSVSIDTGNRAVSSLGSDVFFFVSGSQDVPSGATRKVSVFGGDTVISGTILQKNLTTRPTVAPVSGCLLYTFRGIPYKFTSSSLHQSIGDSYSQITIPAAGTYTLSVDEYTSTIIKVNGTATGAVTIIVPLIAGYRWTFYINSTSTSYSLITIKGVTGTGTLALPVTTYDATYPATLTVSVFSDGTNVTFIENSFDNWMYFV